MEVQLKSEPTKTCNSNVIAGVACFQLVERFRGLMKYARGAAAIGGRDKAVNSRFSAHGSISF